VDLKEIKELIDLLEKSSLKKLHLKSGSDELVLERDAYQESMPALHAASVSQESNVERKSKKKLQGKIHCKEDAHYVTSPMVGTFYASPAPDQPPFVKIGDRVEADTVVCIIEAMKVMNEVKARKSGTIVEILCENAQTVEFETKLFRIE